MNTEADSRSGVAEILSIGDELLLGEILDTNKPYLARRLRAFGLRCAHFQTVGDELEAVAGAFRLALGRARVVIATGGLGPTEDDLTLEALGRCLGLPLEFREEVLDQMAERLRRPKEQFSPASRKQALLPRGAVVLRNHWGTAPGLRMDTPDDRHIFLMPGVPREMEGLYQAYVDPFLRERYGGRQVVLTTLLHYFGIPESQVGDRLKELMRAGCNPDVGTRVNEGVVTVRVLAQAPDEAAARRLLEPVVGRIRALLPEGCFGEDGETLPGATARALLASRKTVAVAESCTAGLVAARLAEVPGISAALLEGAVVYSNQAKMRTCGVKAATLEAHGAVSGETALELAQGIRARAGAEIGIGITGVAGPEGGTPSKPVGLVFLAVATGSRQEVQRRHFAGFERNEVRSRAASAALNLIRLTALERQESP